MKPFVLGIIAVGLLASETAFAQTTQGAAPAGTAPGAVSSGTAVAPAGSTGTNSPMVDHDRNAGAASGNNNQAVATTGANAPAPAKGANSFTMGEAKSRIEKNGFSNVNDLAKDGNGVWRGNAQKGGSTTPVWLDYKGNVGEGK
jgi:hypothetical protein